VSVFAAETPGMTEQGIAKVKLDVIRQGGKLQRQSTAASRTNLDLSVRWAFGH
jgi:rare lipoprotein A (peptidoglycan hydrolase)